MTPIPDFSEVVTLIQQARQRAIASVNRELIDLYWNVGAYISKKVEASEWGDSVIMQLADYIQRQQSDLKGFSYRGLYRMKSFYEAYRDAPEFLTALLSKINWTNHLTILSQCKTSQEREFYLRLVIQERYSTRELERQIAAGVYERVMLSPNVSAVRTQLKQQGRDPFSEGIFRDQYVFEFLDLPERHSERDLQRALIEQMKAFLLELGRDFTFVGAEYRVQVGMRDFWIDLLFFHRDLRCLIAFELKTVPFEPEHLGKLNFYLEALDRDVRKPHENPSIGVLLCASSDQAVVEYALSRTLSPTLVADYTRLMPDKHLLEAKLTEFYQLNQPGTD
ncbi:PDDEXK nuclease domain-containing protein [Fibrella aquatica]|uniref:PDDEXK nuclease domain-containing protein n=1 Tax=Fibrella aquatica TaxID=3242487 RepID=UPI00351F929C